MGTAKGYKHVQMGMKVDNSISEGFFSETQNNGTVMYFGYLAYNRLLIKITFLTRGGKNTFKFHKRKVHRRHGH